MWRCALYSQFFEAVFFRLYDNTKMQTLLAIIVTQTVTLFLYLLLNFIVLKNAPEIIRQIISTSGSAVIWTLLMLSIIISKIADRQRLKYKEDLKVIYNCLDKLYIEDYKGLGGEIISNGDETK